MLAPCVPAYRSACSPTHIAPDHDTALAAGMGPRRGALWVWLPLALPALPLVSGQYRVALWLGIWRAYAAVLWSHLLWVLPWMLLIPQPPGGASIRGFSSRPERLAGGGQKSSALIKCPLLLRPLLAFATSFSQHGAIHANTLARRGAFHPYHRNRGAQQRRQHPILANRALASVVTGAVFSVAALLSRSQAIIDEDYVNAEGQQSHHCAAVP